MKGVSYYTTTTGIPVMFYHFSARKGRDPETEEGFKWRAKEVEGYVGGLNGTRWLQEMEIRFDVRDSLRVFPEWNDMLQYVLCPRTDIEDHWPLYVGYDFGYPNPSVYTVLAFPTENECILVDEIYLRETNVFDQVQVFKRKPYFDQIRMPVWADPAIWARTQQDGLAVTSIGDLFRDEYRIDMAKGQNYIGSDAAFIHLLKGVLWKDLKHPRFRISQHCVQTINEFKTLAWRQPPEHSQDKQEERIAGKNVHCFDSLKYVMLEYWHGAKPNALPEIVGSVDWYIQQMMRAKESARYVLGAAR